MPDPILLEIACFDFRSVVIAQEAGADRIELCEDYKAGGITPSQALIVEAMENCRVPLHVIIRPRGSNFIYSAGEIEEMKAAILFCKAQRVNGVVFGILNADDEIDMAACRELIQLAGPMSVTFHRAIDQCKDIASAVEQLIGLGVDRVLTSGGRGNATDNIGTLKQLQEQYGRQIVIMPGGGVRAANMQQLMACGCIEYHSAAIIGNAELTDAAEIKRLKGF